MSPPRVSGSAAPSRAEGGGYADALAAASGEPSMPVHRIHNTLWSLSDDVADHPEIIAMVEAAKPRIRWLRPSTPRRPPRPPPTARSWVRPPVLGVAEARSSGRARPTRPPGARWFVTVESDLDCWSCHVTGAHHPQGFQHPSQVSGLRMCVRPATARKAHVASPQKANIVRAPAVDVCTDCHAGIKDEGRFDHAKYRPQVLH